MNKKEILETLEVARQGYASLILTAQQNHDSIMELSCVAHHRMLNKMIVKFGGEDVKPIILPETTKVI